MTSRLRRRAARGLVAAVFCSLGARADAGALDRLEPFHAVLEPVVPVSPPAFADPRAALTAAVAALGRDLGVGAAPADAVAAAAIPSSLAAHLTAIVLALAECRQATAHALESIPAAALAAVPGRDEVPPVVDPAAAADIRDCAGPLRGAAAALEIHLLGARAAGGEPPVDVDAWPVLRLSAGATDDVYVHDYLLLVDVAGNDTYDNNAGSNAVDLMNGPTAAAQQVGPAWGCVSGASEAAKLTCTPAAAVLLDLAGDDTYGVFAPPHPQLDGLCTSDWVVRRVATAGYGLLGVGILRDVAGDDRYRGKDGTLGGSHLFGIGILSDAAGDDSYLAIRNAQGAALIGGLGLLHDEGGNDVYDWFMPSALDPEAPNESPGAGGTMSSVRKCDAIPRFVQGIGNATLRSVNHQLDPLGDDPRTVGVLRDDAGDDSYRGVLVADYPEPPGVPESGAVGSQGFGEQGADGILYDGGGADTYAGMPERANDTTLEPGRESTGPGGRFIDGSGGESGGRSTFVEAVMP